MNKGIKVALTALVSLSVGLTLNTTANAASVHRVGKTTTYQAKGDALAKYNVKKFKTVSLTGNYTTGNINYQKTAPYAKNVFQTTPDILAASKSTHLNRFNLKTDTFLPVSYNASGDWGNPQSSAFSKNGRYLFVMYANNAKTAGWVVRYDWTGLKKLGVSTNGKMDILRRATWKHQTKRPLTATDKSILSKIKVGPTFNTGHGQSLALNPKTNQLWFVQNPTAGKSVMQRLSQTTLKPNQTIKFSLKNTVPMGMVLTFDNSGNAYFWSVTSSNGWAPKGSVKIYKGTFSTTKVAFSLVMQGLKKAPSSTHVQSIGFNSVENRLYLVGDESIFTVPVNKLGKLKTSDVGEINFRGNREFEGMIFTHNSANGYLLTNRGSELMHMSR